MNYKKKKTKCLLRIKIILNIQFTGLVLLYIFTNLNFKILSLHM
jgi:hypothetical protein